MKFLYYTLSLFGGLTAFQAALDAIDRNPWLVVPITIAVLLLILWLWPKGNKKKPKRNNFGSGLGRIKL
ncbi:MAG TPA: hypothetical protein VFC36_06930 [Paludibacter sp.]|nr:hypothetical protein [Paludibacter sp.]